MIDYCLLGCGGNIPTPERSLSASIISYKGHKILIDCGEGTQVSMRIANTGFKTVDVICITHCHGDHIIGLPGLLATIANSGKITPMTIIGPRGITDIINGLRVIVPYLPYEVNIIEATNGKINFNLKEGYLKVVNDIFSFSIDTMEVEHSAPCIGYSFYFKRDRKFNVDKAENNNVPKMLWNRLQKGEEKIVVDGKVYTSEMVLGDDRRGIKISLITDTRPMEEMYEFIIDSDLFVCEGNFGSDDDFEKAIKKKHMTFREAATLAKKGKVRKLLLTHFSPAMPDPTIFINNATDVYENTILGSDRLTLELKYEEK